MFEIIWKYLRQKSNAIIKYIIEIFFTSSIKPLLEEDVEKFFVVLC